jgi:hypothetical protein
MSPDREPSASVRAPKLLEQVRQALHLRQFSHRTEESYVAWIRRYIRFHALRHPRELSGADVTRFLTSLAEARRLSASSQTQAQSALLNSRYGCRSSWTGTRSGCSWRASLGHRGSPLFSCTAAASGCSRRCISG